MHVSMNLISPQPGEDFVLRANPGAVQRKAAPAEVRDEPVADFGSVQMDSGGEVTASRPSIVQATRPTTEELARLRYQGMVRALHRLLSGTSGDIAAESSVNPIP